MTTIVHDADATLDPIRGARVAVVGYGNQGRPWALNLRDSGADVTVCVRADETRERATADGFATTELDAASEFDVLCILIPDDIIPSLPITPRDDALVVVASGYTLAFDRFDPACDVGMVAPRMLGPEVRRCYEEGIGFITAFGIHRDATGTRACPHPGRRQGHRRTPPGRHRAHAAPGGDPRPRGGAGALPRAQPRLDVVHAGDARARDSGRGDHHGARAVR